MSREYVVAVAVLIAGALIAAGLFLGLRGGVQPTGATPPPVADASLKALVLGQAESGLEGLRPEIVRECWAPTSAQDAAPARASYVLDLTFDATGRLIARGLREKRGESRPHVATCLSRRPLDLSVPPPGTTVRVEVPFSLP